MTFQDFSQLDIRVGKVDQAENVEDSEKLIRLQVDFGGETRTVFAGIRKWYNPEDLVGNSYVFVYNLEPKKMMGEESQGMILAAEDETAENCVLLIPDKNIISGTKVH